ncbi:MAG TPA: DUF928 domain-containing protein [Burkholderiaceae bacterium]|nr:DUF928 domain-containing protein [Burkholderiaceae bacterium]HRA62383.1 DUF928 domain-containing protein [Burkholderiaceae bacterium]
MRVASTLALLLFAWSVLTVSGLSHAQTQTQTQDTKTTQTKAEDSEPIVYKPPMRGAPARRVGGATRGASDKDMVVNVLAPEQTGLTTKAQPILYWYASKSVSASIEVTLIADTAELPVLSRNLTVTQAGVHAVDLSQYGITLAPDTDYEWFVSVVQDPTQRSKDVTSGGTIRRVAIDPAVQAKVAAAGDREVPGIYADAGIWYDAIASLSGQIERNPADKVLRSRRAALLDQIGLTAAAASDR